MRMSVHSTQNSWENHTRFETTANKLYYTINLKKCIYKSDILPAGK